MVSDKSQFVRQLMRRQLNPYCLSGEHSSILCGFIEQS